MADFAEVHGLLEDYRRSGDWSGYLDLARSPQFQEDLAAWTARAGGIDAAGPLRVLDTALEPAIERGWIGDAAAISLATARWSRRLSARGAFGARRGGNAEVELRTGHDVLRALLRAWELYDAGNPGAARALLAAVGRGQQPLLHGGSDGRWSALLLRRAFTIAPDVVARLLEQAHVLDDNALNDLARSLTAAGEHEHARIAGSAMSLFFDTKADVLADLALAWAEAAGATMAEDRGEIRSTIVDIAELVVAAVEEEIRTGPDTATTPRVPRVAGRLAKAAAALSLCGEAALAPRRWAEARAAAEQEPAPHRALAELVEAQVRAGLLDDAEQIVTGLLAHDGRSLDVELDCLWRAATALVAAFAEHGETARAESVLRVVPDFAHSYPRAVGALARAAAGTDAQQAVLLARKVNGAAGRGWVLAEATKAAIAAGNTSGATDVADEIDHPLWRAQALVDLAGAEGRSAGRADAARVVIAAVSEAENRVGLLTDLALAQPPEERGRILTEATELAGRTSFEDRWRILANIGASTAGAGLETEARAAFSAARRLLAENVREWDRELYQLCQVQLDAGDTAGARETAATVLGALPGSVAGQRSSAVAAAVDDWLADLPAAVASLAAIACVLGRAAPAGGASAEAHQVLAEADRLAASLTGQDAVVATATIAHARTELGDHSLAEQLVLGLLADDDDGREDARSDMITRVTAAGECGVALTDALITADDAATAAMFLRRLTDRLLPRVSELGFAAPDLVAELAAAHVRVGDVAGARKTAVPGNTALGGVTEEILRLPEPAGATATGVVDAMTALMRTAAVEPADFIRAGQSAIDYHTRPWQARARTLAAHACARADQSQRAEIVGLLDSEEEQIWRLATATPVRGAVVDHDDAVVALAVLAVAQAELGETTAARRALDRARGLADDSPDRAERARALAEVARGLSAVGDHATAISVAHTIGHPAYDGQAVAAAITAAARAGAASIDLVGEARGIADKGWRAVALASITVWDAGLPDFHEAHELIEELLRGGPRTQVWQEIIGECLAAGRFDQIVGLAEQITVDPGPSLAALAAGLGRVATDGRSPSLVKHSSAKESAATVLLQLLPRCARYPEAAYTACTALAMAFPGAASEIAEAIAQIGGHNADVVAVTE